MSYSLCLGSEHHIIRRKAPPRPAYLCVRVRLHAHSSTGWGTPDFSNDCFADVKECIIDSREEKTARLTGGRQTATRPLVTIAPLAAEQAESLAPLFKALAHPIRLQLVSLVASNPAGEACVCSISSGFGVSLPTISHHLRMLREAGVLDCQRRGTWVYYRACPDVLAELAKIIGVPADYEGQRDRWREFAPKCC